MHICEATADARHWLKRASKLRAAYCAMTIMAFSYLGISAEAQIAAPYGKSRQVNWLGASQYYVLDVDDDTAMVLQLRDSIPRGVIQTTVLIRLNKKPAKSGEAATLAVDCSRDTMKLIIRTGLTAGGPGKDVFDEGPSVDLQSSATDKRLRDVVCDPEIQLNPDLIFKGSLAALAKDFWK